MRKRKLVYDGSSDEFQVTVSPFVVMTAWGAALMLTSALVVVCHSRVEISPVGSRVL